MKATTEAEVLDKLKLALTLLIDAQHHFAEGKPSDAYHPYTREAWTKIKWARMTLAELDDFGVGVLDAWEKLRQQFDE